ncbi:MAG TPA: 1-acyl-sn-glycerol-3-phosphate acyltransferase [Clostridiales bacterium]|nr:1-acyl-sn-glycerol-3-phosphate acyltransferase [Clostridiales bacterium]
MTRAYLILYNILRPIAALLYPLKVTGRELVPEGAAIVCAPHSSYVDAVLLALALGKKHILRFMAKAELFSVPVIGWVMRKCGAFGVNRGSSDINAIRTAIKYLKNGEKIMIFPEGTRVASDDAVAAKSGAVRLASKLGVPIVPVYLPRNKKVFSRVHIRIGEPFRIDAADKANTNYSELAEKLMSKIYELKPETV